MSDLISRESAIVRVSKVIWDDLVAHDVKEVLKALPSAERKAEWIHYGTKWKYRFTCSLCNYHLTGEDKTNFCPNCGAEMERGEEE